jgi:glycosyltransferase involved in cell wall biosynthesis
MSSLRISLLICSWQAPHTLDETLRSIAMQERLVDSETVLVNNGFSKDRADELKQRYPFVDIVDEPTQGLAHARRAGFRTAKGDFFACMDDDNILGDGFLRELISLINREPNLGCICPVVVPSWETKPPLWMQEFGKCCLSYNSLVPPSAGPLRENVWRTPDLRGWPWPPGGGMIIHRSIAEDYSKMTDEYRLKLDRVGNSLGGSGDQDIYFRVASLSLDTAYSERLVVYHQIPQSRTKFSYLLKLNFRMTQDWAALDRAWLRDRHPFACNNFRGQLIGLVRSTRNWIYGRTIAPLSFLEMTRQAGYLYGWVKDAVRGMSRNK